MNATPELSIVVVNWNTRDLLLRLLGQLFVASRLTIEVLVVDNDSSDDSVAMVRERFPAARVLPQDHNGGFAFGVNRGLEAARGRWILLLNTDADADPAQLEAFVRDAERHPDAAVFGPRILDEHGTTQRSTWRRHLPREHLLDALFLNRFRSAPATPPAGPVDCVSGCVFLIRRDVIAKVGGFDERYFMYFEEADFCERVRRAGHRVYHLPSTSFVHAGGLSAAQSQQRTFLAYRESALLYHARWHGRPRTELVRAYLVLGHLLRLGIWLCLWPFGRRGRLPLYRSALAMLLRPGLVRTLSSRRPTIPTFDR